MTPPLETPRWRRVEDLFYAALDLDSSARQAFLDDACGQDRELRKELSSLLESSQQTLRFAREAVQEVAQRPFDEDEVVDHSVGAYRLLKVIGKGGMGTVYLATRADDLYHQNVAVKLMHANIAEERSMRLRFSAERQILAKLNHPHIGRLLDGGITADGLPYLVMEYVDGMPIDAYCREHRLSTENLINLFLEVCAAVEYAHQNLVIHRDIKPGNILVTPEGVPKLLDFGIAKLLDGAIGPSNLTLPSEQVMTLEYASPEQVTGTVVTTATDVYALGVLLYELLCGVRPFQAERGNALELLTMICERYPEPPSKARGPGLQAARPHDYRRFREDLDNIVLMAMRKEPERRYESVALFANDLRRCLEGYPVRAHADTWTYGVGKFIRRHKAGVIAATIVAIALVCFSAGMALLAKRATRERRAADQQRLAARREADFLASIFEAATPDQAKGQQVTARELLDAGAKRIDGELSSAPEAQATMLDDVGRAYTALGAYDQAKPLLERSYTLRRKALGDQNLDVAATADGLATLYRLQDNYERAEPLFRQALAIRKAILGNNDRLVGESLSNLGECLFWEGHNAEAELVLRQALALVAQPDNPAGAWTRNYLALELEREGDIDEGLRLLREAVDISKRTQGEMSPSYAIILQNFGGALERSGDLSAAEMTERRALQVRRRISGDEHPDIGYVLSLLGAMLLEKGDWNQAKPFLLEALNVRKKLLGEQHLLYAWSLANWARVMQAEGDYANSESTFQKALKVMQDRGESKSWSSARILSNFGLLKLDQGNYADAERYGREALEIDRALFGKESPDIASSLLQVGVTREFQGDAAGAELLFREALQIREKELHPGHPKVITAEIRLGEVLTEEDKLDLAEPVLLDAMRSAHNSPFPLLRWQVAEADIAMGAYLAKRGQMSRADSLLRNADAGMQGYPQAAMRRRILHRTALLERAVDSQEISAR